MSSAKKKIKTCFACSYSYMEPDADYLICGHEDSGILRKYLRTEPLDHCGFKKFKQHPLRNENGSLKKDKIKFLSSIANSKNPLTKGLVPLMLCPVGEGVVVTIGNLNFCRAQGDGYIWADPKTLCDTATEF